MQTRFSSVICVSFLLGFYQECWENQDSWWTSIYSAVWVRLLENSRSQAARSSRRQRGGVVGVSRACRWFRLSDEAAAETSWTRFYLLPNRLLLSFFCSLVQIWITLIILFSLKTNLDSAPYHPQDKAGYNKCYILVYLIENSPSHTNKKHSLLYNFYFLTYSTPESENSLSYFLCYFLLIMRSTIALSREN